MSGNRYFINNGKEYVQVHEYLEKELKNAGFGGSEILKTPMGHRVLVYGTRPGMIIGKSGRNIKRLTNDLAEIYGLESPRLEVKEVENPELDARISANKLVNQIERGFHFRRAGFSLLRRIMASGARGCEIIVKGKLTSQRARSEVFRDGFIAKTGEISYQYVDKSVVSTVMKQGVIGVHVLIMQPDSDLPDEPIFYDNPFGDELEEKEAELKETTEIPKEITSEESIEELVKEETKPESDEVSEIIAEKSAEEASETVSDSSSKEESKEAKIIAEKSAEEASKTVSESSSKEESKEAKIIDEDADLDPSAKTDDEL